MKLEFINLWETATTTQNFLLFFCSDDFNYAGKDKTIWNLNAKTSWL